MRDVVVCECEGELYGWWDLVVVKSAKPCALASILTHATMHRVRAAKVTQNLADLATIILNPVDSVPSISTLPLP